MAGSLVRMAVVLIALVAPAWAAPRPKPEAPTADGELKRMQGTWLYESQTIGGREIGQKSRDEIWVEIEGDILTKAGTAGGRLQYKVTLDPSAKPPAIDLVSTPRPSGKTFTQKGIYEWDGKSLRMCFDNTGKERPKEFRSPDGQDNICVSVLKRKAK